MARAGLRWTAQELATAAGVGYATVARFETGQNAHPDSVAAIRVALEGGGATFIGTGEASLSGGAGVRLRAD